MAAVSSKLTALKVNNSPERWICDSDSREKAYSVMCHIGSRILAESNLIGITATVDTFTLVDEKSSRG